MWDISTSTQTAHAAYVAVPKVSAKETGGGDTKTLPSSLSASASQNFLSENTVVVGTYVHLPSSFRRRSLISASMWADVAITSRDSYMWSLADNGSMAESEGAA